MELFHEQIQVSDFNTANYLQANKTVQITRSWHLTKAKREKKSFNANNMTSCKHIRISTWNLLEKSVIACAGACSISQEALVVIANKILRIGYDCYKAFMTK